MRGNQLAYVSQQVINASGNDLFSDLVQFGIYAAATLLICFIFAAFKFSDASFAILIMLLLVATTIVAYCLKAAMTLAISCHVNSIACRELALEQILPQNQLLNTLFWKAQRPITIRVGSQFMLDSNEYIVTIFGTIIFNKVIDLLMTF